MKHTITNRGFKWMEPIPTQRGVVSVYESSSASAAYIWLAIDENDDEKAQTHISIEQAREIAAQLIWLADNHYLADREEE